MSDELLRPYSIYLPQPIINKLKDLSKSRRASSFVREAILSALDSNDDFNSGFNKGLREACRVIKDTKEASTLLVNNELLSDILIQNIEMLEQNGK
jgi:predicted DNA-binding protein